MLRQLSGKRGLTPASVAEYRNPLHPAPSVRHGRLFKRRAMTRQGIPSV